MSKKVSKKKMKKCTITARKFFAVTIIAAVLSFPVGFTIGYPFNASIFAFILPMIVVAFSNKILVKYCNTNNQKLPDWYSKVSKMRQFKRMPDSSNSSNKIDYNNTSDDIYYNPAHRSFSGNIYNEERD